MRILNYLVFTFSALSISAGLTQKLPAEQLKPINLVQDNSLEGPLGGHELPKDWQGRFSSPNEGYQFRVVDKGRTGDKSLLIHGEGKFGVVSTNKVRIDQNMRYRARGWVKIEGDAQAAADVKFHYFDDSQQYLGQTRIVYIAPPTKDWTMLEVTDRVADFPAARWIQVAVAMVGKGKSWYDDLELTTHRRDNLPSDFDLTPELKILNRWAGDWNVDVKFEPARWTPEGSEKTETKESKWILQNTFLEEIRHDSKPSIGEHRALTGFDMRKRLYRTWYFDSNGNRNTASGTWDEKTATMTWMSDLDTGGQLRATDRFIDADTHEYSIVIKRPDGELLMDGQAIHRRSEK